MYTQTIVVGAIALIAGTTFGAAFINHFNSPNQSTVSAEATAAREIMPMAADFVSLRPSVAALPSETLSDAEISGLLFMREEEKLARDVYQTLYEKWQLPIFANIAQSEQTHTEAVRTLIEKYALTDPVTDDSIGMFTNPDLAQLYTELVTLGLESQTDALTVGAKIEDLDIKDLAEQIALTDNQDIALVYENLKSGSENHLRAFSKQLARYGATYTPEYISDTTYATILETQNSMTGNSGSMMNGTNSNRTRGWGMR